MAKSFLFLAFHNLALNLGLLREKNVFKALKLGHKLGMAKSFLFSAFQSLMPKFGALKAFFLLVDQGLTLKSVRSKA
jgi:hypothetical protein